MQNPETGFLQAIVAEPDDDVHRLVFADWLEEQGQIERAEFIRTQVEFATLRDDSPRRRTLAFRARELLEQHDKEWLKPVGKWVHDWRFARGFVEMAGVMACDVEEDARSLFAATPVRRLWVTEMGNYVDALAAISRENCLRALDLCGNALDAGALEKLTHLDSLAGLSELGLLFTELDDTAVKTLCESDFFRRLSLIRLGGNPFSDASRAVLRDSFGERVSFDCEREADYLYTIRDEHYFYAGFVSEQRQLLMRPSDTEVEAAFFDHAGNLLETQSRSVPAGDQFERETRRRTTSEAWLAELKYKEAPIVLKRFHFESGGGIDDFAPGWVEVLSEPNNPEHETGRQWLDHWLVEGKFRWGYLWFDGMGIITDT
jgi:uncharacterized protein (TIGR02996 family)